MTIPKVQYKTGFRLKKELLENEGYTADTLKSIHEANPCVSDFIVAMAAKSSDHETVTTTAILVYKLIETQFEINQAADTISDGFPI